MTPPARIAATAWVIKRRCGLAAWISKYWLNTGSRQIYARPVPRRRDRMEYTARLLKMCPMT